MKLSSHPLKALVLAGAIVGVGLNVSTAQASSSGDLSPWEMFCFLTSKDGQDLADCLNGLPVRETPKVFVAPESDDDDNFVLIAR